MNAICQRSGNRNVAVSPCSAKGLCCAIYVASIIARGFKSISISTNLLPMLPVCSLTDPVGPYPLIFSHYSSSRQGKALAMAVITEPNKKWQLASNCAGILWPATFTLCWIANYYLATYRSIVPQPNLGRVYPLPYRRLTLYVTKIEYILAGPPMWCVAGVAGVTFVVVGMLYTRSLKRY